MIAAGVDSPRIRYLNVQALLGQGENSRAIEEMLQLVESDPDNAQYMLLLGEAQFAAGNWTAALEQFQAAYEEQSTLVDALYYAGRANIELGNSNEAIAALTTVAQRSDSGEYHYWLGVALELGLQPTQAYGEYVNAVDKDIAWSLENPEIFHRRGMLLLGRGGLTTAYRDFRVFNTLRPTDARGWWAIGQVFFEQRRWVEAIDMMQRSLALNPDQPLVHYSAALAALNLEPRDNVAAAQHLEIARDGGVGRQRTELYQKLGYVYRDLGRPQDAVATLREYLNRATLTYDERRETENEIRRLGGTP
jgi:tetratricopeptide (TPR) repeat protein